MKRMIALAASVVLTFAASATSVRAGHRRSARLGPLLVAIVALLAACRLAGGTGAPDLSPPPQTSATAAASQPNAAPTASIPTASGGISEEEATSLASQHRDDQASVWVSSASGRLGDLVPDAGPFLDADRWVWVVRFAGAYHLGCDYRECPVPGMQDIVLDFATGEQIMSAVMTEGD
jgi:hypothetical protein